MMTCGPWVIGLSSDCVCVYVCECVTGCVCVICGNYGSYEAAAITVFTSVPTYSGRVRVLVGWNVGWLRSQMVGIPLNFNQPPH